MPGESNFLGKAASKAGKFLKDHFFTAVIAGAVALLAILLLGRQGGSGATARFEARIPPVEFLYLDGPRILNLLSELEGGEVGEVHRISKEITNLNGKIEAGPVSGGASSQFETSAEASVTQTEASELGLLIADLEEDDTHGVRYHNADLENADDVNHLEEGTLIKFSTRYLLSPGYIRPYIVIRQTATLAALFPATLGSRRQQIEKKHAEAFSLQIGPDPRLTFAVAPQAAEKEQTLKLLLPMSYHGLTQERSLLEKGRDEYTGGKLTVFGLVIRVFPKPTAVHCQEQDPCDGKNVPEYTDYATREIWKTPLKNASDYLINRVSHNCEIPRSEAEMEELMAENSSSPRPKVEPLRGRLCFLRKLERQTEVFAPGAVIVPIAIYKGP
jgi:hypothetical protein